MKTEKRLKLASYFLKFLMSLQLILITGLIFIYFHSIFSPNNYNNLTLNKKRDLVFNLNVEKTPKNYEEWKQSEQLTYYNLLDNYSKFYVIWTKVIMFSGFLFILYLLNKFLKNTKNFDLFFTSNIKILNKIIFLISILFVLDFILKGTTLNPISMVFNDKEVPHFITKGSASLDFLIFYPLGIIFFYVLKEVFKRGQELKQENDLTI
ncbi:hypothetical protein OBPA_00380 [Polaribacter sp. OB-PA-B3]